MTFEEWNIYRIESNQIVTALNLVIVIQEEFVEILSYRIIG